NAAASLAAISANADTRAIIFAPATAPLAKLTQILQYGAILVPVDGNYDRAFDLAWQASEKFGWYNRNTG
ncbi:MAG TPA: threonine synthase, partial [Candidatus Marinimicrobia bacterium]|nr:threonine synthase [Candidatus Neomarinimicrobiota bacterium]